MGRSAAVVAWHGQGSKVRGQGSGIMVRIRSSSVWCSKVRGVGSEIWEGLGTELQLANSIPERRRASISHGSAANPLNLSNPQQLKAQTNT